MEPWADTFTGTSSAATAEPVPLHHHRSIARCTESFWEALSEVCSKETKREMRTIIRVERANCCVFNNSINREIASINGVYAVNVDNYKNEVTIDHTDEVNFPELFAKLRESGYNPLEEEKYLKNNYNEREYDGLFQE